MSYMNLLLAKGGDPKLGLRLMEVPVEWRDGRFVATGDLQDRPAPQEDLWGMLMEEGGDDYPFGSIAVPDGWTSLTHFWQPGRYVPASSEVRSQARRDAVKKMLELGLTTPEQAEKLLEGLDD